jgi:hypothetical protein
MWDGAYPNNMEGTLTPSGWLDHNYGYDELEVLRKNSREAWECSDCGRLAVFEKDSNKAVFYKPEGHDGKGLFKWLDDN